MENDFDWTKAAIWLWGKKELIGPRLGELQKWFSPDEEPESSILIIGPGGVGKSTAAQILEGRHDSLFEIPTEYQESIASESYVLKDDEKVGIVVPPGQRHRRDTWSDVLAAVGVGGYRGIIAVGAHGYHSLGEISFKDHRLYHDDDASFLTDFLAENRADELDVLQKLRPHICANTHKCWLLTLVTKQDLWWHERAKVEKHYRQGEYGTAVDEMIKHCGGNHLRHEFVFGSLIINNFVTGRGEELATTTAGYDEQMKVRSLKRLWEALYALKSWEESQ